jgi:tetratricopeptide (TPR) repeat protein
VKRALSIFKDEYLLERALACHIILGTCYNNLGKFQDALDTYQLAERILDYLPKEQHKKYRFAINNNLGNCFEFQGKYLEAVNYYLEAIQYLTSENPNITILNLIRCYYTLGDFSNAKKWLQKAQSNDKAQIPEKFHIQYKVFETIIADKLTVECMMEIQKLSINYFLSMNDWMLTVYYSKLFAALYESNNLYKQANSMYKLALQIRNEKLLGGNAE